MPDYFRTLGIPMLKGREFTADDRGDRPPVAIITKTMATQLWPGEDPIGKRFAPMSRENIARFRDMDGREPPIPLTEVVGVVADVRHAGLASAPGPQMYVPYQQFSWHTAQLIVRTSDDPRALVSNIRADVRALNSHAIVTRVRTMDDAIDASTAVPRLGTWVATLFATIGALLAALGLYGVMAHGVAARTREIGIRVALGAPRGRVVALILRQGLAMTLMGITIGAIGFTLASRIVARMLFETSPADPVAIAGTVALLVGVALAAAYIPARRATQVDPLVALRDE
jgi:predicted permease